MFMDSQEPALIAIMYGNHAPDASILGFVKRDGPFAALLHLQPGASPHCCHQLLSHICCITLCLRCPRSQTGCTRQPTTLRLTF